METFYTVVQFIPFLTYTSSSFAYHHFMRKSIHSIGAKLNGIEIENECTQLIRLYYIYQQRENL